jgi:GT2 family glycosyltransferase
VNFALLCVIILLGCRGSEYINRMSHVGEHERTCDIDIVVTVHNRVDVLRRLLHSIEMDLNRADHHLTSGCANTFLVNSGSDEVTSSFIEGKAGWNIPRLKYVILNCTSSYTKAVNTGIAAGLAKEVIILNSDVVLPRDWIRHLQVALSADPLVGMAGPLSNSACYQSIPRVTPKHWSKNTLPAFLDIEKVNSFIRNQRSPEFPHVPLINGFAMILKRTVFHSVGYFNETAFPIGYGEENEFCMRVCKAGFGIVIADNLYVQHQKSATFGETRRQKLIADANGIYDTELKKYITAAHAGLRTMPALERLRRETSVLFAPRDGLVSNNW